MRMRQHCSKYLMVLMILLFTTIADSKDKSNVNIIAQRNSSQQNLNESTINKLNNLIVPKIIMENVSLSYAVNHLHRLSKMLDSDRVGINFIVLLKLPGIVINTKNTNVVNDDKGTRRVTINMQSPQSLRQVVRHVCQSAGVKYEIKNNSVIIARRNVNIDESKLEGMPK
ncbi:MAG: hypothetical protein L3J71_06755 [Victivallaceae bacterium]|nr:hypothetical protein [Victivallaceae bacterium]